MKDATAVVRLSALAHRTRLMAFRLLVKEGASGLAAGEIARRLKAPPTTMSAHLAILTRAKLVVWRREGRVIRYSLNPQSFSELLSYLVSDCCGGQPELCGPILPAPSTRRRGAL